MQIENRSRRDATSEVIEICQHFLIGLFHSEPLQGTTGYSTNSFPANLLGVTLPSFGVSVLGVRVPWYSGKSAHLLLPAWEWLETTTTSLKKIPSIVIGDPRILLPSA